MDDFIPTRAARARNEKNVEKLHQVITYKSRKASVKSTSESSNENELVKRTKVREDGDVNTNKEDERRKLEKEMKRFRYDIIKFGMSGFEKDKAQEAKTALAIGLGAKPLKNKVINYKKLKEERRIERAQERKKKKFASGFDLCKLKSKNKGDKSKLNRKKGKASNGILGVYGKVSKQKASQK